MIRKMMILAALAALAPAALAQSGAPDGDDPRYQFTPVDDGYLRLDLRSGQVSLCNRRPAGWACLTTADDRAALEQEIGRLQNENVALKKSLLAHGLPLPDGIRPLPSDSQSGEGAGKSPGHAEVDRMVSAVERVWRRLLEMIGSLQKDLLKKT